MRKILRIITSPIALGIAGTFWLPCLMIVLIGSGIEYLTNEEYEGSDWCKMLGVVAILPLWATWAWIQNPKQLPGI